jgi:hypothetical protein
MVQFSQYVSLGVSCFPAIIFKKMGLRSSSGPFDWCRNTFDTLLDCLDTNFSTLLDEKQCFRVHDGVSGHVKYGNFYFSHKDITLPDVREYYLRCVSRFRETLGANTSKLYMNISHSPYPQEQECLKYWIPSYSREKAQSLVEKVRALSQGDSYFLFIEVHVAAPQDHVSVKRVSNLVSEKETQDSHIIKVDIYTTHPDIVHYMLIHSQNQDWNNFSILIRTIYGIPGADGPVPEGLKALSSVLFD